MQLRNGAHGYGLVTKSLHWLTVAAVAGQFVVGRSMDLDDDLDRRADRLDVEADRLEEAAENQGETVEEGVEAELERREEQLDAAEDGQASAVFTDVVGGDAFSDGLSLPETHVGLGLLIIALGAARLLWRRTTPLPPWAGHLSAAERRLEGALEKFLLWLLVLVPGSGLVLVAAGEDWLPLHVGAQVAFLVAIAGHVALVLRHTVVRRDGHLLRML